MTHAEALAGNTAGLLPSSCPGELIPRGRFADRVLAIGGAGGEFRERTVEVLRCESCRAYVSMCDGKALNSYERPPRPPRPEDMVEDLARALDGRGPAYPEDEILREA